MKQGKNENFRSYEMDGVDRFEKKYRNNIDPDANPLYNKNENPFTDALLDHFEEDQKKK